MLEVQLLCFGAIFRLTQCSLSMNLVVLHQSVWLFDDISDGYLEAHGMNLDTPDQEMTLILGGMEHHGARIHISAQNKLQFITYALLVSDISNVTHLHWRWSKSSKLEKRKN